MNLTWHGKDEAVKAARKTPYRLLRERAELSYPPREDAGATADSRQQTADSSDCNLIIQGDNLSALKSLLPFYAGQVKCIFIDPPYNTGSAFSHYDDNLEHSLWLNMMYPRLELLRELLAEDGSIWITLDDNESHYCKVMCDEIFGRKNFVANVVWQKVYSQRMDSSSFSLDHDNLLVYRRSSKFKNNKLFIEQNLNQFKDFDENVGKYYRKRSLRKEGSASLRTDRPSMWYGIEAPDGTLIYPVKPDGTEGRWRWKKENVHVRMNELEFIQKGESWEIFVKQYAQDNPSRPPSTVWLHDDVGNNHEAKNEVKLFNADKVFDTPKPERLIQRILQIATNEGDLVLDSFLGSGTTAAVAHKMNRRYIGIEIGQHAQTHVVPRLQKVIDGEQGGISGSLNWQGGGSFRFCELGEPVFDAFGSINPSIKFPDLAAHVWYLENRVPFTPQHTPSPLLGLHNGRAYYLLYNGILGDKRPQGGNVLTKKVLAQLPQLTEFLAQGVPVTIYGEATRLTDLAGIAFKQIPYDISAK